jgi:hypothetical protein
MPVKKILSGALLLGALSVLPSCVQYPTGRQSVVDMRPQLTFQFDPADARMNEARVFIDALDAGRMGDFLDGKGALRVLPGNHTVRVVSGAAILLDERVYVGDGVVRPFVVK